MAQEGDRTYCYFVSFTCLIRGAGREWSCAEVHRCCPIRSIEDLAEIAQFLEVMQGLVEDSVVVISYHLLRVERDEDNVVSDLPDEAGV